MDLLRYFRPKAIARPHPWSMNYPLHWFGNTPLFLGDLTRGLFCLGQIGSGKSSGVMRPLLRSCIRAGYGGLITTYKRDDIEDYRKVFDKENALDRLIEWGPESGKIFNGFEGDRGTSAHVAENIVEKIMQVAELGDFSRRKSGGGEKFFEREKARAFRNVVTAILLSGERFQISTLAECFTGLPQSEKQCNDVAWKTNSPICKVLIQAIKNGCDETHKHEFERITDWLIEWSVMNDRTRTSIYADCNSVIDSLNRGLVHEMMGGTSNFSVEDTENGMWILCASPVAVYHHAGLIPQVLAKYCLYRSAQKRNVNENPRPIVVFCDEAQYFVNEYDSLAATTGRSSNLCLVFATQSIPALQTRLGECGSKNESEFLLANFTNKVFAHNTCAVSDEYAATLIGKASRLFMNGSSNIEDYLRINPMNPPPPKGRCGFSEQVDFHVRPIEFTSLERGGRGFVEAIIHKGGEPIGPMGEPFAREFLAQE